MDFDLIAIGDTVVDAFIRLKDAKTNRDHSTLTLSFGDKIPYESVEEVFAVGNAANASVSASRLGLKSALVTNLGSDENGKKCLSRLEEEKVSTEFVSIDPDKKTNHHYVLWYEDGRTILVKHEKYEYKLPDLPEARWIYLSSLAHDTLDYHLEILKYLNNHPETKLAFQPGTFQLQLGREKLKEI